MLFLLSEIATILRKAPLQQENSIRPSSKLSLLTRKKLFSLNKLYFCIIMTCLSFSTPCFKDYGTCNEKMRNRQHKYLFCNRQDWCNHYLSSTLGNLSKQSWCDLWSLRKMRWLFLCYIIFFQCNQINLANIKFFVGLIFL